MAASCLHLPSKSHRGIAKIFAQVNSLQKIIAKTAIRSQKDFFSYYSYPYTNRVGSLTFDSPISECFFISVYFFFISVYRSKSTLFFLFEGFKIECTESKMCFQMI